jgi:hypothetical protein
MGFELKRIENTKLENNIPFALPSSVRRRGGGGFTWFTVVKENQDIFIFY